MQKWALDNADKMSVYAGRTYSQVGHAAWRAANREYAQNYHLVERYGITVEQWFEIFEWQDHKCACCGREADDDLGKLWQVDHDHDTKQIRGIICAKCNRLIGQLGDKATLVVTYADKILNYLANSGDVVS